VVNIELFVFWWYTVVYHVGVPGRTRLLSNKSWAVNVVFR